MAPEMMWWENDFQKERNGSWTALRLKFKALLFFLQLIWKSKYDNLWSNVKFYGIFLIESVDSMNGVS